MTVNKTQFQAQKRLPNDLQALRHGMRALKNPQPVGADVLKVQMIPAGAGVAVVGTSSSIAAGSSVTFIVTNTPGSATQTLWNFQWNLYVDALDFNHRYSRGSSLTSGQKNLRFEYQDDYAESSDVTNVRVIIFTVYNLDSSSHVYYFALKAKLPELAGAGAS